MKVVQCVHEMFRFEHIDGGTDLILVCRCSQCREILTTTRIPAWLCLWCGRDAAPDRALESTMSARWRVYRLAGTARPWVARARTLTWGTWDGRGFSTWREAYTYADKQARQ